MSDRVEYIRHRLDALEAAAKAARPGPWRLAESEWDGRHIAAADGEAVMGVYGYGADDPYAMQNAEHIALWDPAAVLARVAADRAILAEYERAAEYHNRPENRDAPAGEVTGLYTAVQLLAEGLGWTESDDE